MNSDFKIYKLFYGNLNIKSIYKDNHVIWSTEENKTNSYDNILIAELQLNAEQQLNAADILQINNSLPWWSE